MSDQNQYSQQVLPTDEFAEEDVSSVQHRRKFNWPFVLGLLIVLGVIILAFAGPTIAPKDPLEENIIIKVGDEWFVPPFPLLTTGFPLGSDQFGRDLWSRLLWAIRPTLIMVVVVAVVRLMLGVLIGLLSGWLNNRFGNLLDNLIEGALSIPVLLIALGAIAVVGAEYGIWAFIIGLSLTGWVETAQQVREQTKIIKGQTFIEAARALGSSNRQILGGHIVRQITPMLLMLFAFEVSSTLMTTAGLGFLGYYIGGDVWIEVGDFVARRLSGMPELGQMLATSWASLTEPWGMVAVGTTIFVTILGFNLIGEGLRSSLNYVGVRRGFVSRMRDRTRFWLDQNVFHPAGQVLRQPVVRFLLTTAIISAVIWFGGVQILWPRIQNLTENMPESNPSSALAVAIATPTQPPQTGQLATPPQNEVEQNEPKIIPTVLWEYHHSSRFATGAAFDEATESFYIGSQENTLLKFDLEGNLVWEVELPAVPFDGLPQIDSRGNIYVADEDAGVTGFTPDGAQMWYFVSTSAPNTVAGLVMGADETLYYVVSDYSNAFVQAVSTSGEALWVGQSLASNFRVPLDFSADGRYLFHRDDILDITQQSRVDFQTDLDIIRFVGGEDGNNYLISGQNLLPFTLEANSLEIGESGYSWGETTSVGSQSAPQAVLIDADQVLRIMFTSPGGTSQFVWQNNENDLLGISRVQFSDVSIPVSINTDRLFSCGSGRSFSPELLNCALIERGFERPVWEIDLGSDGPALPGFWYADTFYFSTSTGAVYAITQSQEVDEVAQDPTEMFENSGADDGSSSTSLSWRYALGADIQVGPDESSDGHIFLATREELVIVNPDGTESYRQEIAKPWLVIQASNRSNQTVHPFLVGDQTWVAFYQDGSVTGQDSSGEVIWEFNLDHPADDYPYAVQESLYVVDTQGTLYHFNADGLVYKFVPTTANRPASGLAVREDGTVYYTITNRAQGFVQAVTPDGSELWVTEAQTDSFYSELALSNDGSLLFLKEDIYQSDDGRYIKVDYPFQINQFIPGEDGNNYAWSDRDILQWRLINGVFEVLKRVSLADFLGNQILSTPEFFVNANSILWARQFSRGITNWRSVFMTMDGEMLGQYIQNFSGINYDFDPDTYSFKQCRTEADALVCGIFEMITGEFTERKRFEGTAALGEGFWIPMDQNSLLFFSSEQEIMKLDVE